ncbi:unnamed protein product [Eruca vesicaria subsp. sativa]|uniref:Inositol polyphosphate-related phosphatase domain-containing protein n=1 Tax=Eruca vesicaria subsp. sativa TaxID=29727 RepID=A0ABC8KMR2_ERUVS|nr:unnamed protein product [Eruca vesicaria subsp. sativa]
MSSSSVAEPAGMIKKSYHRQKSQRLWAKLVMRKWLNISARDPEYGADTEDESENDDVGDENQDSSSSDEDCEESSTQRKEPVQPKVCENAEDAIAAASATVDAAAAAAEFMNNDAPMKLRRRNSETLRAQYINNKEIRVCVGTWNVGGISPPSDLDIDDWIEINQPADIYILGLQEIGEVAYETDSDAGVEIHPIDEEEEGSLGVLKHDGGVIGEVNTLVDPNTGLPVVEINTQFSSTKKLDRQVCLRSDSLEKRRNDEDDVSKPGMKTLNRMLSGKERIGLSWPEPPLNMLGPTCVLDRQPSLKTVKSLRTAKSFKAYSSFKSVAGHANGIPPEVLALAEMDLKLLMERKRRPAYVRLVSKQMVGILLTIWVKRSLRKHIQNVRVSTVGVGIMGYIGNKGAVSVSMSINQTFFCFICTHLTAGEREVDQIKRNADVHEIHKRTVFHSVSALGLPKLIYDHERIIWLGDLNYRLNLSYEKARDLISKKEWSNLLEYDQLVKEYKKGRAFDGWSEGTLHFPPTYKYQAHSDEYTCGDGKGSRRTPAWCDRVLSYGNGMKLVHYRRTEQKFSDHRPVTAIYMAEVEVFSARKLQKALTFTDAEIEDERLVAVIV